MRFEFATATRIIFGPGAVREAPQIAVQFGRRALVVTGRNPSRADALCAALSDQGVSTERFCVPGEPEIETVRTGVNQARQMAAEGVIAFGGGSALDAGKAIAAMARNPGDVLDYLEVIGGGKSLPGPGLPFIAIPTTAGTGSEVTRNAVLASPEHRVKVSLRSPPSCWPRFLVDPELTHDLPREVTASTGLDALTQLIEPFVCCRPNPMVDALCVEGIRRAARSLRAACADGRNASAREDMALASLFGGLALANAGLGAVHGFAGPIGGMFPAPHGAVCAALLPHAMAANLAALRLRQPDSPVLGRFDRLGQILTGDASAAADDAVSWVLSLVRDLRIPKLGAYGITPAVIPVLVEKAAQASSMKANPIPLTAAELTEILQQAL